MIHSSLLAVIYYSYRCPSKKQSQPNTHIYSAESQYYYLLVSKYTEDSSDGHNKTVIGVLALNLDLVDTVGRWGTSERVVVESGSLARVL